MIRSRSGDYGGLYDWFTDVHKNPLAYDTPQAVYYRQMLPFISDYERGLYNLEQAEEYMAANGLTWDTVDPMALATKFPVNGFYKSASGVLKMSKNVLKLYR